MPNILDILAGLLGQGGGGNMLSPSAMGPNAMDRQPAMAMGAGPAPVQNFAPDAAGSSYSYEAGMPPPAPQGAPAAPQGGVMSRIMGGGNEGGMNGNAAWLVKQGMDPVLAKSLAGDPKAFSGFMAEYAGMKMKPDEYQQRATWAMKLGFKQGSPEFQRITLGLDPSGGGSSPEWSKLDDGRLFNQKTGETRDVGQPGGVANPTDDIKEYQYAKANGQFKGSFTEWQTKGIKEQDPTFQREMDLRQQYDALPEVKDYKVVRSNFERIREGVQLGTGAGDAAIVFGYMKMLDPNSVVREGEQANASNAAGVPEQVRGYWNKLVGGGQISGEARNQILAAAEKVYAQSSTNISELNNRYKNYATTYKINPDSVYSAPEAYDPLNTTQPTAPTGAAPTAGAPAAGTIENGYRFKGGDPGNPASWEPVK